MPDGAAPSAWMETTGSAYPASVYVPVVLQAFLPPRPSGTWRLIAAGAAALPPLCPGSRTTTRAGPDAATPTAGADVLTAGVSRDVAVGAALAVGLADGTGGLTGADEHAAQPATTTLAASRPARMRVTIRGDRECNRVSPICR